MEDSEHIDLDSNGFNLIDFSTENDNLFFIVSPLSHHHKSPECQGDPTGFEEVGDMDSGNVSQGNDQIEQVPELAQSEEPQRSRSGKCNLRKSLAWDNAFFTSAGVLDPEELTSMMDECEVVQKQFLPGIQEDIERSTDSISTLESDTFTLESLEAELFDDIRASIQKSSKSAKGSFGTKAILQGGDQDISSPNGDTVSRNQLKSMPVIKEAVGMHKIGVPKCQPKVNTGSQGSTKAVKPEYSRPVVPKSAVRTELASSLAKPSKGTSKSSSTIPSGTKFTRVGPSRLKPENVNAKTVSVRGSHVSKTTSSCGPGRVLSKPASTSQSSSSSREHSMAKSLSTRSSSQSASNENSSEDKVKHTLATVRRKAPPKAVNSPPNCATPQPSSKNALKNKAASKNSALAAYLMSSKVTASTSPSSSVSEWSSTSSSSSANQKSNKLRSSFGSSSCRSLDDDARPLNLKTHADQIPCHQEIKKSSESIKKPSSQTVVVPGSTSMKPTGLKMPSPKIGFFDGVKSVRASSGAMQSHGGLPVASTKVGSAVGPRGTANIKHKVRKLPPGRVLTARKNETEKRDAPFPSQRNPQVTPHIGDHGKKMVESNVRDQENGSEEHGEVSLTENLRVAKNERVLGNDQDFCLKDVKLVDPDHGDSKTDSCGPMIPMNPEMPDALKLDGHHNPGSSLNSCCKIDEKEYMKLQENGSEEHDEVSVTKNLCVIMNEMMLGDNQELCLKEAKLVDPEHKYSKPESCGPMNTSERLDSLKLDGHHNPGSSLNSCCKIDEKGSVKLQENASEEHDEVSLTENLHITKNEMMLDDNQDLCLKVVKLVGPEINDSKTESRGPINTSGRMDGDHEKKMVESNVKVQENGSEEHDEVSLKENLRVTKNEMVLGDDQDFFLKDVKLVDGEHNLYYL